MDRDFTMAFYELPGRSEVLRLHRTEKTAEKEAGAEASPLLRCARVLHRLSIQSLSRR